MITKEEVMSIMEITSRQIIVARENAVKQERTRLRSVLNAEVKENLDPEWNYAIKRALELVDSDTPVFHPVMTAAEIKALSDQVAAKIERLGIAHE